MAAKFKDKACPECGVGFTPRSGVQVLCGSPECKAKRIRRQVRKKNGTTLHTRKCVVCGEGFTTAQPQQVTCGKSACKEEHRRALSRRWSRENPSSATDRMNLRRDIPWNIDEDSDPWKNFHHQCAGPVREAELCPLG